MCRTAPRHDPHHPAPRYTRPARTPEQQQMQRRVQQQRMQQRPAASTTGSTNSSGVQQHGSSPHPPQQHKEADTVQQHKYSRPHPRHAAHHPNRTAREASNTTTPRHATTDRGYPVAGTPPHTYRTDTDSHPTPPAGQTQTRPPLTPPPTHPPNRPLTDHEQAAQAAGVTLSRPLRGTAVAEASTQVRGCFLGA